MGIWDEQMQIIISCCSVAKSSTTFFMVQLSHPYMTTGKTTALTRQTCVSKVMSLPFNTLSSIVIAFLPRSRHLLISWLQSLSAVILEPKKIKSATISTFYPSICHEVMGSDAMVFVYYYIEWISSKVLLYSTGNSSIF